MFSKVKGKNDGSEKFSLGKHFAKKVAKIAEKDE